MKAIQPVGVGTRTLNCIIDTLVVFTIAYFLNKAMTQYYLTWHKLIPFRFGEVFAIVLFAYYFIAELFFKRTIGKVATYTIVINITGGKPKFWQILLRSLVRLTIIDLFFFPFLKEQTLHDFLSRTIVTEKI